MSITIYRKVTCDICGTEKEAGDDAMAHYTPQGWMRMPHSFDFRPKIEHVCGHCWKVLKAVILAESES